MKPMALGVTLVIGLCLAVPAVSSAYAGEVFKHSTQRCSLMYWERGVPQVTDMNKREELLPTHRAASAQKHSTLAVRMVGNERRIKPRRFVFVAVVDCPGSHLP